MRSARLQALVLLMFVLAGCGEKKKSPAQKAAENAAESARLKDARKQQAEDTERKAVEAAQQVPVDPFWDDPQAVHIEDEKKCPPGMWALFPGRAPGGEPSVRKNNEALRHDLAKPLKESIFIVHMTDYRDVQHGEHDAGKGAMALLLKSVADCEDTIGRIAFAFGNAKPQRGSSSAVQQDALFQNYLWTADRVKLSFPLPTPEAAEFQKMHKFDLDARVAFKLGKTEIHKKMERSGEKGEMEDWGAGRLVRAKVLGYRIYANNEKTVLLDTRKEQ